MLWGLADHFVDELIQVYRSRAQAERALRAVLRDEPSWAGMFEVVLVSPAPCPRWRPHGRRSWRPRCRVTRLEQ